MYFCQVYLAQNMEIVPTVQYIVCPVSTQFLTFWVSAWCSQNSLCGNYLQKINVLAEVIS